MIPPVLRPADVRSSTPAPGTAPLCQRTLPLHAGRVRVPHYERTALTPSVVHFSVGGFHRAHQLVYFDDLAERGHTGWGVIGIGLRSAAMRDALAPQDLLYTVVERGHGVERARVIGSMVGYHVAPEDPGAVLARLTDQRTRLVTMTVTCTAYRLDPATGEFDPDDDEIRADLTDPHHPRSLFGFIVEALDRRRRAGTAPFTVLSCDNVPNNGETTRTAVVGFARLRDEVLARWIADHVAFPGSMVDRITPATTPADRAAVTRTFGVDDRWPVVTEPFSQWVLEDAFCNGRPPLEEVGVQFVGDIERHELLKTRLLNGSHAALGHLGLIAGHERVHEVMADPVLCEFLTRLMADEVAPLLALPEGIDVARYQQTLLQRFADPAIGDRLDRLCRRGSSKLAAHLVPSLRSARAAGRPAGLLTLAVAAWCRAVRGTDLAGRILAVDDERAVPLRPLARDAGTDPRPLLAAGDLFGDLADDAAFVELLTDTLRRLDRDGLHATVTDVMHAGDRAGAPPEHPSSATEVRRRCLATAVPEAPSTSLATVAGDHDVLA